MKDNVKMGKQDIPGTKHGFRAVDFPFSTPEYRRRVRRCLVENRKRCEVVRLKQKRPVVATTGLEFKQLVSLAVFYVKILVSMLQVYRCNHYL